MNSKQFSVFEDLFELSEAADNLIEKTLAESAFDENFFEDTKKEIYRVLINKSPEKKKKSESKCCFIRSKRESIFQPFLEIRSHVHRKPHFECSEESRTLITSKEESTGYSKTEVGDVSLFNKYAVKVQNNKGSSGGSWKESSNQLMLDNVRNFESKFEKYIRPCGSNVCRSTYRNLENIDSGNFHERSPISNEYKINPIQNEETITISSESDEISSQSVITVEKTDIQSPGKSFSSKRVDQKKQATTTRCVSKLETNVSNLNKTWTLNSDSNKESICSNILSSSSDICCDCSALSFSAKKQNKESKSFLQDYRVSPKNYSSVTSSGYVSGNPFEENTSEKSPLNLRTRKNKKPHVNEKESSITSIENDQLSIMSFKEPHRCSKNAIKIPSKSLLLASIRESVSTSEIKSSYSGENNSSTSNQSLGSLGSDSGKSRGQECKSKDILKASIQKGRVKFKRKSIAKKKHFRVFLAPVNRKVTTGRNLRPKTPTDFMNSNHQQSLKVKAEEKRKQREIRVQRTKERRERLEREREERMRSREQKLKKRFQQHEKILKEKTEAFKIKWRIREQSFNKRSGASTSSKDSKEDRTKDNDDFCRNAANSGQKLYKESNDYRDVTPEENDLVSLDGDVGLNPEISQKEKAILKGCEQTPVEFPVCNNKAKMVDMISLKKGKKPQSQRDSNLEQLTDGTRPVVLKLLKHSKGYMLSKSEENESPKLEEKNGKFENEDDIKCRTPCAKRSKNIDKASKELSKSGDSKQSQNTYLLRSAVKKQKKVNDTTYLSINKGENSKCENLADKKSHAKIHNSNRTSSDKEKMCTNFCFKINKNQPKKVTKAPKKHKIYENNACKSFTKPTKFKMCKLYDSPKEAEKAEKVPRKKQTTTSYEIPEEVGDSSEDTMDDFAKIPQWATGIYLKQALIQQLYHPPNVEKIFGVLGKEPVNLVDLFGKDKPSYHHRTSSENWSHNETPK